MAVAGFWLLVPLAAQAGPPASLHQVTALRFSMNDAEDADENEAAVDDRFRLFNDVDFTFIPGVWAPRMDGDIALGPSPASRPIDIDSGFDLRDLEPTFLGELEITKHEIFTLIFTGFSFSTEGSGTFQTDAAFGPINFTPGDPYTSDFELNSFSGELTLGVFRPFKDLADGVVDLRLSPMFAARYIDAEINVVSGGTTATGAGEWLAPLVGLRTEIELFPKHEILFIKSLKLDAAAALGPGIGGDGGFIYQVRAGISAQITDNFGATFGYRLIDMDLEDGPFTLDTQLAGLFLGGIIRF